MDARYPHLVRGILCALFGGIFWGFSGNCGEVLMHQFGTPAEWLTPVRMLMGAVFFMGFSAIFDRERFVAALKDRRMFVRIILFGVFGVLMMQYAYLCAIDYAGAGTALTLEQLNVVFVMVWICFRGRRLPRPRELAGVVLAFAGVVVIATQGDLTVLNVPLLGLVWGIASALATSFYNLLPQEPLERYGTSVVNGYGMLFGFLACMVLTRPWTYEVQLPPSGWLLLVGGLTGVGTIAAYFLYIQGVKDAGPMRASLLACSEPVAGTFIAAVWTGSTVTLWDVIGLVLIIAMVCLVTQKEDQPQGQGEPSSADGS